jgi:predicted nucleic acid-binding protein
MRESVVVDASTVVDLLVGASNAVRVRTRLSDADWHAPAHLDMEVLSALGRLSRSGKISAAIVEQRLSWLASAPIKREALSWLLVGAWKRRGQLLLSDALYVELAEQLGASVITSDDRLVRAVSVAESVSEP